MAESESGSTDSGRRHSGSLLGLKLPPERNITLYRQQYVSIDTARVLVKEGEEHRMFSQLCRGSRIPLRPAAMYGKHKHGMFKTAGTTSGASEAPDMQGYIPSRRDDNGQVAERQAECKSLRLFSYPVRSREA
jgi:hypothetical protein